MIGRKFLVLALAAILILIVIQFCASLMNGGTVEYYVGLFLLLTVPFSIGVAAGRYVWKDIIK